jgi:hypothetical protein
LHVIVCPSQTQDAQSPSLKHASPEPVGPGEHVGPPLELELLVPGHMPAIMPPAFTHCAGQAVSRHAVAETDTAEALPQPSLAVQAATVPDWERQATRHVQFASLKHAW